LIDLIQEEISILKISVAFNVVDLSQHKVLLKKYYPNHPSHPDSDTWIDSANTPEVLTQKGQNASLLQNFL